MRERKNQNMSENISENCNFIDAEQEVYNICAQMAYNRNFSQISRLNEILETFAIDSNFSTFKILLFYIYYILLRADEREVLSHIKTYVIKTLNCIQEQTILSKTASDPQPTEEESIEEQYMNDFMLLILNKYNPDWGNKIENFDYKKIHKFNVFVYKTQFCKFKDYFLILFFLWGGLFMDSCPYFSQYDKDIFYINCEDMIRRIPNPYDEEFQKRKMESEQDNGVFARANQINLY